MATVTLGNIKFNWKGAWNSGTAYVIDDVVSLSGSSYVSIQAGTNQNPASASAYWQQMSAAGTNGTNGTDVGTTITTQGDILYRDGSGLQRLAKGTASQVLKMNSSANAPEWGNLSSDWVLLGSATTSATSDLHVDLFSADYDIYKVFVHNWYGSAPGNGTQMQFNTSANTPQTGNNYRHLFNGWYWNNSGNNTAQRNGGWNSNELQTSNLGDGTDDVSVFEYTFVRPFSASTRTSVIQTGGGHENNHIYSRHGHGYYNATEQHTGFTLKASSGTITIEYIRVYGIKTS
tara:strand:- start:188 stop:1054 length:867 start_codon:yes stop_codon:yes gene_type:complete